MVNILYRESSTATKPASTSVKGAPLTILELDGNFRSVKDEVDGIVGGTVTLNSVPLSGTPTAPTAAVNTNTTQIATTAFVVAQIADDAPTKTGTGASGTWNISISGNAATATNGVVTTGSYANPAWITSLAGSKLTGTVVATDGVVTTGSYANPAWITSLAGTKVTNAVLTTGSYADPSWITSLAGTKVTNAVLTTGSYADPTWITSLAGSKLTGTVVATNGVVTTGSYANPSWITSLAETKVLPTQSGNTGRFLTTNGTSSSWSAAVTSVTANSPLSSSGGTTPSISVDTTASMQIGSFGVGTTASGTSGEIRATNNITAYYSDDRLKTKLGDIEDALNKVCSLSGFYYEANETAQALGYDCVREVGVSAQQVQKILPEVVAPAPIDDKYMTVRYEKLIPLLIEAIKELSNQVKNLKG